ncbi:MAG: hypothetical protein NW226_27145 [Microscillaceae bacterium]|nr:hypothetical protein [Microscillaceae bacterium]
MKELIRKDWEYILFEENQTFTLSVLVGTVALYHVDIILNEKELKKYQEEGQNYLDLLAEEVRNQPEKYLNRANQDKEGFA